MTDQTDTSSRDILDNERPILLPIEDSLGRLVERALAQPHDEVNLPERPALPDWVSASRHYSECDGYCGEPGGCNPADRMDEDDEDEE